MDKYVTVEFLSERDGGNAPGYTYCNKIGAKKYDTVIVPTKYGISMAVVIEAHKELPEKNFKYGMSSCTPVKEVAEVIESKEVGKIMVARKKKDLKKQLEKKVKELDDVERFKMYADLNPEFAKLLKEYTTL